MSCLIDLSHKTITAVEVIQVAWLKNHPRCCPICMESFDLSKGLVDTPCGHKFCLSCYVRLEEPSCPMCRAYTPLAEPNFTRKKNAKALRNAMRHHRRTGIPARSNTRPGGAHRHSTKNNARPGVTHRYSTKNDKAPLFGADMSRPYPAGKLCNYSPM